MQEIIEIEAEGLELKRRLEIVKIVDQPSYDLAVELRVDAKAWIKQRTESFDRLIKPAYDAYKNIHDTKKKLIEPAEQLVASLNEALVAWDYEQEKLRRAEQERLAAEARKKEEEERLAQAVALEESGADEATIASLIEAPATFVPAPVAAPTYEKSKSVVMRDNFTAEITDFFALVKAIAKDKSKLNLLVGITQKDGQYIAGQSLNQLAKALKQTLTLPGVKVVNNRVVASGRG